MLIAVLAGGLLLFVTPRGPGVSRDSAQYFRYAMILRGQLPLKTEEGVAVSVTHYPPLFPTMLAALNKASLGLLDGARVVNAVSYGLTGALAALIVLRHGRGTNRAVLAAVAVLLQPAMAFIHLWVVSEPPFLLLTLLIFGLLLEYRTRENFGLMIAVLIGLCLATAGLTRYVGVAFLPAAMWVLWRTRTQKRSLLNAIVVAVVTMGPLVLMAVMQRRIAGEATHRDIGYEPLTSGHLLDFLKTVRDWLFSPLLLGTPLWKKQVAYVLNGVTWLPAGLIAVGMVESMRRFGRRSAFGSVAGVMCGVYFGLLLFSIAMVDHGTPLDDRLLAPVAMLGVVWLVADFPVLQAFGSRAARGFATAAVGVVAVNALVRATVNDVTSYRTSFGFNDVYFRDSHLVAACAALPPQANIYSNYPEPILLHGKHAAFGLPGQSALNGMQDASERGLTYNRLSRNGFIAFFSHRPNAKNPGKPLTVDQILAIYPVSVVKRTPEGTLFQWDRLKAKRRAMATQATTQRSEY